MDRAPPDPPIADSARLSEPINMIVCGSPDSAALRYFSSFSCLPSLNASSRASISFQPATDVTPAPTISRMNAPLIRRFQ